jgi:CheY-like chemotaxis protein
MQEVPGRPSLLHLEDDSNDAELIKFHLRSKRFDCVITWVKSSAEFIEALETGTFDLVLSDYRMPGFTGDDALRVVRTGHTHLPFIMLTGELGEDRATTSSRETSLGSCRPSSGPSARGGLKPSGSAPKPNCATSRIGLPAS